MGRSQRHMILEQGAPSNGEAIAEGQPSPAYIVQASVPPELREGETPPNLGNLEIVEGPPGGPLQGSTLSGAIPVSIVPEPPPAEIFAINYIDPFGAEIGSADLTLHVVGNLFEDGAVIVFNGGDEVTTFVSATELTTGVKPSTATVAGAFPVVVRNPGGELTEAAFFTFTEPAVEGRKKR